ncbi:MAG: hypothetical protein GKR89_32935 [Candidatus Latescibacteria bacterium]|nr:hypothetical protein [Candidatus Latescibacterota bacterium]
MSAKTVAERIRWAPKVHPDKIHQLYEAEASGLLADELVDEVGIELLLRVESIMNAMGGCLECPRCGGSFAASREQVQCPQAGCGWGSTFEAYMASKRHRDLNVANALPAFEIFGRQYPQARSAAAKMRLIDRLIHEFHWDAKQHVPNRSVGNNLIEGSHQAVVGFLDQLSAGSGVDKAAWRRTMGQMWARRRGQGQ